jgi:signal transduction histidine kinase
VPRSDPQSRIEEKGHELSPYVVAAIVVITAQTALIVFLLIRRRARRGMRALLEERLRFETLLSQLSTDLIHVPATGLAKALEQALGQVVAFLGADRGALDEHEGGASGTRVSWAAPGIEELPWIMDAGQFPWSAARLKGNEIVRFSRTTELPDVAATDRASYERVGTRSHVSLPLRAGGPLLGALSLDAVRKERAWSDELVARLRLLSEAFSNALERRRMELSLADRLAFEKLLSSLSTTFSNLSAADFDREVERALRRVVAFLEFDRGTLMEFSRDGAALRTWTIDGGMSAEAIPWTAARIQRGEIVAFARLEDLPRDAAVDRDSCVAHGIAAQIALPLAWGAETIVGGLVFGAVRTDRPWRPDDWLQGLRLLGEVFANALARRQVDVEAQRLRQELAHIGRVSAMGELTASLAHELNQPLTAILNNAQVAQRFLTAEVLDVVEIGEILKDIVSDNKRAADVIRRLRLLLKKGDLEYVSLDLNEVVTEVARLVMSDAAIRNVSMRLDAASGLPRVSGDRVQLQQVVLNLVLNGLDAMREPGAHEGQLVIRTFSDDAGLVGVAVQDAGPGIAEKDADQIFNALYTTKSEGIGMGLAIARTIVDAHGGRLTAGNNPDSGATFRFTLPVEKAAAQ